MKTVMIADGAPELPELRLEILEIGNYFQKEGKVIPISMSHLVCLDTEMKYSLLPDVTMKEFTGIMIWIACHGSFNTI
jgi:hypothetical protein